MFPHKAANFWIGSQSSALTDWATGALYGNFLFYSLWFIPKLLHNYWGATSNRCPTRNRTSTLRAKFWCTKPLYYGTIYRGLYGNRTHLHGFADQDLNHSEHQPKLLAWVDSNHRLPQYQCGTLTTELQAKMCRFHIYH